MEAVAETQDTCILQFLLQQDGIKIDQRDGNGTTALLKAAQLGNVAAAELLLQNGADAYIVNILDKSAAFVAAQVRNLHILKLLIQHGVAISASYKGGFTLLMQAAFTNQPRVAKFLIDKGVSVLAVDSLSTTALHYATLSTKTGTETMRLLLAHGAGVNACNRLGTTPLHSAASSGQFDRAELLIAAGADVLQCDDAGHTALHTAVCSSHAAVVKLLLEHGAAAVLNSMQCLNWEDCARVSALLLCIDTAVLKLLLTAGADVHAVISSGDTCLHIAARYGYPAPVLCLLIKAGADMHAVNNEGKTAAEVAHYSGNTLIEQLLNRAAQQA
eukprot:7362-Heterococcus_DN1.PRE.3